MFWFTRTKETVDNAVVGGLEIRDTQWLNVAVFVSDTAG